MGAYKKSIYMLMSSKLSLRACFVFCRHLKERHQRYDSSYHLIELIGYAYGQGMMVKVKVFITGLLR